LEFIIYLVQERRTVTIFFLPFYARTSAEALEAINHLFSIYSKSHIFIFLFIVLLFTQPEIMRYSYFNYSFFYFIHYTFGMNSVFLLKKWIHNNKDLVKLKLRNKYLLECKRLNLTPKHLSKYETDKLKFYNEFSTRRAASQSHRFIRSVLNLEISDNYKHLKVLIVNIHRLTRAIERSLPSYICNQFFTTQQRSLLKFKEKEKCRLSNKLIWNHFNQPLNKLNTNTSNINNIKNIKYVCCNVSSESQQKFTISLGSSVESTVDCSNNHSVTVVLDPSKYERTARELLEPREQWFYNTTKTPIPNKVIGLLQLGEGFCLPPDNKEHLFIEYIKHIENNFSKFKQQQSCVNTMRIQLFNFLKPLHNLDHVRSNIDLEILDAVSFTKKFIKENPELLFTRADKGNTVVALDRTDYMNKMKACLSDSNTYIKLKQNPANKLLSELKIMIKRWNNLGYISAGSYSFLNASNAILPRAYGLPKIHKAGHPLRIIVSSTGSPLHNLALFLHKILIKSLPPHFSHIKNSLHLMKKISNIHIPDNICLASFDVVSLFTNVPTDMVLDIIKEKWSDIKIHTNLPLNEFVLSIEFVLQSTYFHFNNIVYRQTFGTPMGSPLSPVIADLILQRLELSILTNLSFKPTFFYRYVDDIILAVPLCHLNDLFDKFNSFHQRLKFTMEVEENGDRLNFLDLSIIKKGNSLIFDWFRKPTFSGRFLNYHSHHPFIHKRGTIYSLIDRVIQLSHPEFHQRNFDHIIRILLDNGYPLSLIFSSIRRRLHARFHSCIGGGLTNGSENEKERVKPLYFTIPYVSSIASNFIQFFKKIPFCKLAFSCLNKLDRFVGVHKDVLPVLSRSNVVYQINCRDCDSSYVGQTKRTLRTRVNEHRNHVGRSTAQNSVITDHRVTTKHDFDWDRVKILDKEMNLNKRLISEMIFIKKQKHGLNAQTDTALLDVIYNDLFGSTF